MNLDTRELVNKHYKQVFRHEPFNLNQNVITKLYIKGRNNRNLVSM